MGKSTLFNALLKKQQALAANYPFATIEPNVGIVAVPDSRLIKLAEITKMEEKMDGLPPLKPATVEFLDIAGLVKGASEGAGLGNKFLSHIREVSVIAHVVRAFADENVIREGSVSPEEDYSTIVTELMIADIQSLEKQKDSKAVKTDKPRHAVIEKLLAGLNNDKAVRDIELTDEEREIAKELFLLSNKPELIVLNVSEEDYTPAGIAAVTEKYSGMLKQVQHDKSNIVVSCAQIEAELSELSDEEQAMYLADLGLKASGLERLIQKAYTTLGLISFLTAGEKEVRAWTIKNGTNAQYAAGEIHTDFIKKFIKAEIVGYEDFVTNTGWKGAREHGKARLEGKEYIVKDGDIVEFKIGA